MRILLSRTDSIGDVMLSLPMAGFIKKHLPGTEIHFMGRTYTRAVIEACEHVDSFINYDDLRKLSINRASEELKKTGYDACLHVFPTKDIARLVKKSGIPLRIGTGGRLYNWMYCNRIVRFTRRRSGLHESQLNLKLLSPLGIPDHADLSDLIDLYGFTQLPPATEKVMSLISKDKANIILHPKSKGSAVEWGLENFSKLLDILPSDRYHIFISGTDEDAASMASALPGNRVNVTSLLGKLSLDEFVAFIALADGLIAASTGPLHIAAACGKVAIGLYSSRKPIHPGRWAPLGKKAVALVKDENCKDCAGGKVCQCIKDIRPERVRETLDSMLQERF